MRTTAFRTISPIALSLFALTPFTTNGQDAPRPDERGRKEINENTSRLADEERLTRMKQEVGELQRAGKHDEAQRLAKELENAWKKRQSEGEKHGPAEGREKLQHLFEAIKHLRAAGLNEPARDLEQMAGKMREQLEQQHEHAERKSEGGPDMVPMRQMHRQMQEMREQMQRMSQELQQMREQLQRARQ